MSVFSIFLEPFFWIIMGVLYALLAYSAKMWANDLGLKMNWWKWFLTIIWFVFLSLVIAGGFTLIGENEPKAGVYFLGSGIVLSVILGVVLWRILKLETSKKQKIFEA